MRTGVTAPGQRRSSADQHPDLFVVDRPSRKLSRHDRVLVCKLIDCATGRSDREITAPELARLLELRNKLSIIKPFHA